jgi:hypothetical protein
MKKILFAATLTVGAIMWFAVPAVANHSGDAEPACADIDDASLSHSSESDTVSGTLTLAAKSCGAVTYTLVATYTPTGGGETQQASSSRRGAPPASPLSVQIDNVDAEADTVCVFATTTSRGLTRDRAPDSGCNIIVSDGSPGGGFWG